MDDLISRQAAILHLKKRLIETAINNTGVTALCDSVFADTADNRVETWIMEIPSAHLERKPRRWKREVLGSTSGYGTTVMYQCSECGKMSISKYGFCPNCGAKMEVDNGQADH